MIWALHGAVGMAADWKDFSQAASAKGETVRSVDLWRYLECCPVELWEFAKAFNAEVRAVDTAPVLMGYSLGGRLALHVLLDDPELWKGATIVSAHTGLPDERARFERMAMDAEWAALALTGEWKTFLAQWMNQGVLKGSAMSGRSQLEVRRQAVARSFMDWSLSKQDDLLERLAEVTCPVKWVVGERDEKFFPIGQAAVSKMVDAQLYVAPGVGHRVPWEAADWFTELVCAV